MKAVFNYPSVREARRAMVIWAATTSGSFTDLQVEGTCLRVIGTTEEDVHLFQTEFESTYAEFFCG